MLLIYWDWKLIILCEKDKYNLSVYFVGSVSSN